jgi:hypothetical protein
LTTGRHDYIRKKIDLLEAAVTQFISAILRIMLASREEECKHKEQTNLAKDRVYRILTSHRSSVIILKLILNVGRGNVEHALEMIGFLKSRRDGHSPELSDATDAEEEDDEEGGKDDEEANKGDEPTKEDRPVFPLPFTLRREICTPLVCLMPLRTSTALGPELMTEVTLDDALDDELLEQCELDELGEGADVIYENNLCENCN